MAMELSDALKSRVSSIRWSAAIVLAGFLLNAGLVVLLVAWISGSVLVSLITLGVMAAFIVLVALFGEAFRLSVTGARPLQRDEFFWLRPMVTELCSKLGINEPEVLISDHDDLNAYTTGIGRRSKIVFMSGLLRQLSHDEVQAVAAHELGHVVNRDVALLVWTNAVLSWVSAIGFLAFVLAHGIFGASKELPKAMSSAGGEWAAVMGIIGMVLAVFGFLVGAALWLVTRAWVLIAELSQLAITRQREWLADTTAAAMTGEPQVLASALEKIAANPSLSRGASVVGPFCIVSPAIAGRWWDELTSTHPSPARRIEELRKLAPDDETPLPVGWRGVGSTSVVLPLGTVALLALLVLSIPLMRGGSISFSGGKSGPSGMSAANSGASLSTPTPAVATAQAVVASTPSVPFSLSNVQKIWQAGGLTVRLDGQNSGFVGFSVAANTIHLGRGSDSMDASVLVYKNPESVKTDWSVEPGKPPVAVAGRALPSHASIWWNQNVVVVAHSRTGSVYSDALAAFLSLGP